MRAEDAFAAASGEAWAFDVQGVVPMAWDLPVFMRELLEWDGNGVEDGCVLRFARLKMFDCEGAKVG